MSNSPLRAQVWPLLRREHTVLPATHTLIHKWNEPYMPLLSSHRVSPHFGRYSFSVRLRVGGWVGLCVVCTKVSIVFSAIIDYMCRDFTSRRRVSWNELSRQLAHRSTFISVRRSQAAVQYERFNSNSASLNIPTNLSITTSSSTSPPSRPTGHLFQVT